MSVEIDIQDRLATVSINRPEVRNALSRQVLANLRAVLARLRDDDAVGTVAFTGAGEKAFAAGEMQRLFDDIEAFEKPTIAAVNGFALGGGCELALACDIRIAADTALIGLPETTLSVLPGTGGTQRLARLVGTGRAVELILTGRFVDAAEAYRIGLVSSVVPADGLTAEVRRVAAQILGKLVIRAGMDADQRTGLVIERLAQALLYTTADKREGAATFLAKRAPAFEGS